MNTVNREIFIGKIFVLKIFCRVNVLRKYLFYNIEVGEERTERVTAMEKFFKINCICGYHVYEKVWVATVGEALVCERKPKNSSDQYTVAVKNEGTIIEHLHQKLSRVCSLFLQQGSTQSQV